MITLNSKWGDFKKPEDFRAWLDLAKQDGKGLDEWWGDMEGCDGVNGERYEKH